MPRKNKPQNKPFQLFCRDKLLKPSGYWESITQTTQKGGYALISLPVTVNLTKQKPVDDNSNKKAKLTFQILHFYCT